MSPSSLSSIPARIVRDAALASPVLAAVTWAGFRMSGSQAVYPAVVIAAYAAMVALLLSGAPERLPGPGMGPANRVTLFRATLALPVAGLLVVPSGLLSTAGLWWAVAVSGVALALDGVDGAVARATRTATDFGARFDMELDAFLILALSGLVWMHAFLGPWVLAIGLIRYLFVAAAWLWPFLANPLPASLRRRAICVVQVAGLLVALAPAIPPALSWQAAFWALALLAYSFVVDVAWLARRGSSGM